MDEQYLMTANQPTTIDAITTPTVKVLLEPGRVIPAGHEAYVVLKNGESVDVVSYPPLRPLLPDAPAEHGTVERMPADALWDLCRWRSCGRRPSTLRYAAGKGWLPCCKQCSELPV